MAPSNDLPHLIPVPLPEPPVWGLGVRHLRVSVPNVTVGRVTFITTIRAPLVASAGTAAEQDEKDRKEEDDRSGQSDPKGGAEAGSEGRVAVDFSPNDCEEDKVNNEHSEGSKESEEGEKRSENVPEPVGAEAHEDREKGETAGDWVED